MLDTHYYLRYFIYLFNNFKGKGLINDIEK